MSISIRRRNLLAGAAATFLATAVVPLAVCRADTLAQVDVYDRTLGESLPIYRHRGRQYIEGLPGNEYAVRIRNCTQERLLAVLSVDGVNVVTGETASPDQSGYVIEPGGYVTVQGWRKDLDRTAAFYFTDPGDSYAGRTGRPDDLGVIGVALFREQSYEPRRWWRREDRREPWPETQSSAETDSAAGKVAAGNRAERAAPTAPAAQEPSLGTGHGRGEYSPVRQVGFERAGSRPDELVAIRYERRETLAAIGVLPWRRHGWRHPDPFPGSLSFVPDP